MNIPEALVSMLSPIARVFPSYLPENWERPALIYRVISESRDLTHDGPTGLVVARYQLTSHADSHSAVLDLVDQVRKLLNGFSGDLGAGVEVSFVELSTVYDLGMSEDSESWQIATDIIVRYRED